MKEKVILAYSGGLDTSIIIPYLMENYDFEVIAACINVGQDDDMKEVREKALKTGASKIYIENMADDLAENYLYPAIKVGGLYENKYFMGTSLARPSMSKRLVEIAHKEGAKYICHGCTGKGNDQVRFEVGIACFDPTIKIIAPWRTWDIKSREDAIDYAEARGIDIPVTKAKIYSRDKNIWHTSHEGGDLENPSNAPKDDLYLMVTPPEKAPDKPTYIDIYFEKGEAKKLNGKELTPLEMVTALNKLGGENGIGIADMVEDRLVGMKSRGIYETPGGTILFYAHEELERLTIDKDTFQYKILVAQKYAQLIYDGLYFTTLRKSIQAFVDTTQENVTGNVKLKLYKGNMINAGTSSDYALFDEGIASFGASDLYSQKDSEGFINLFSLPCKIKAMKKLDCE
ncbi:MAG: argininosuccinate synthase [Clostridiaceae bacterium]